MSAVATHTSGRQKQAQIYGLAAVSQEQRDPGSYDGGPGRIGAGRKRSSRENWAGTFRYSSDNVLQPASVADVQKAVTSVPRVRALGTRHSFNGIADSKVAQISTLGLKDFKLDAAAKTVTVGAGIK